MKRINIFILFVVGALQFVFFKMQGMPMCSFLLGLPEHNLNEVIMLCLNAPITVFMLCFSGKMDNYLNENGCLFLLRGRTKKSVYLGMAKKAALCAVIFSTVQTVISIIIDTFLNQVELKYLLYMYPLYTLSLLALSLLQELISMYVKSNVATIITAIYTMISMFVMSVLVEMGLNMPFSKVLFFPGLILLSNTGYFINSVNLLVSVVVVVIYIFTIMIFSVRRFKRIDVLKG